MNVPKTIWFLWLQGIVNAPIIVRKCYQSWLVQNPGWDVVVLDQSSIRDYVSIETLHMTPQALSDILRINILAEHGGVWVDATCFCMKPLDSWLFDNMSTGFFAFNRPGPDRMLSSWFLASEINNRITLTYRDTVNGYWESNPGMVYFEDSEWGCLKGKLKEPEPQMWFESFVTKILKVHPYFWFHYLFENLYLKDEEYKRLWDSTPNISADIPHRLQFAGLFSPLTGQVREEIDAKVAPLYKLTWKIDDLINWNGTVIEYLLAPGT